MARLITSLYSTKTLHQAWKAVKQKNSAGGIDGLTVEEYEADLGNNLRELQLELKNKSWRPEPYFRIEIKKKKTEGERRKLGLLTIKDKIVQQAIKSLIEQRFENLFLNNSYGYRPDKGHTRAIKRSLSELKNKKNLIKYFHKYHKGAVGVLAEQYAVSIKAIDEQLAAIKKVDGTTEEYREKLIAIEAGAAVAYWEYIRVLIEDDNMEFETRERKGAKDLMNSLLNYGYAILYARVWQALLLVKLNPTESIIHVKQPGKPTFVYDVIELFRAQAVDRVVIALIQKKEPLELEKGLLSNETKGLLIQNILERLNRYEKYRGEEIRFTDILIRQAREIAAYIIEEASNYKPYLAKW